MNNRKRTDYTNMSKYNKYISGDPRTAHLTWQPGDSVQFYLGLMADLTLYFIRASGGSNYNEIINIEDFQEDYLEAQEQYPGSEIILKTGVTRKPITYRQAEQYVIDTLATTENILHNYQKLTNQTREEAKQDFERLNYSAVYINKLGHMDTQEMLDALLGKPRIPAWLERKLTKTTLAEAHKHTNDQIVDISADLLEARRNYMNENKTKGEIEMNRRIPIGYRRALTENATNLDLVVTPKANVYDYTEEEMDLIDNQITGVHVFDEIGRKNMDYDMIGYALDLADEAYRWLDTQVPLTARQFKNYLNRYDNLTDKEFRDLTITSNRLAYAWQDNLMPAYFDAYNITSDDYFDVIIGREGLLENKVITEDYDGYDEAIDEPFLVYNGTAEQLYTAVVNALHEQGWIETDEEADDYLWDAIHEGFIKAQYVGTPSDLTKLRLPGITRGNRQSFFDYLDYNIVPTAFELSNIGARVITRQELNRVLATFNNIDK